LPAGSVIVVTMGAPSTVILSDVDWFANVTEVAVTLSVIVTPGATTGALYITDVEVIAVRVPFAGGVHLTPAPDVSLSTVAEMGSVFPEPTIRVPDGLSTTS
jgi:hypothetical protein